MTVYSTSQFMNLSLSPLSLFLSLLLYPLTSLKMLPDLILFLAFMRIASASCYAVDNSMITSTDYQPCNSISGSISMCCAINRGASSTLTPDTCLPNGLCQNIFTNETTSKPDTNYWREGCSDSGWNSKYCLAGICASSVVNGGGDAEMTPCDGTPTSAKWCCGTHNTACCGTGQEIVLAATLGAAPTSATSATSQSSPSSSLSSTSTQASNAATSSSSTAAQASSSSGLSTGAIAGIGIGCAALAALVVVAILCFWQRKKSSRDNALPVDYATLRYQGTSEMHSTPKQESTMPFHPPSSEASMPEMQGDSMNPRSELP